MPRTTRRLVVFLAALVLLAGAYSAYWFVVAGQIRDGLVTWAESARKDKIHVSWQNFRVSGFPAVFQVDLETAALRDNAVTPSPEFRIPALSSFARPWNLRDWHLVAADGFTADIAGAEERTPAKLTARTANGAVALESDGGWKLHLTLQDAVVEAGTQIRVESADTAITAPPKPPGVTSKPTLTLAVDARDVGLPVAVGPLGVTIDELDFAATVKGAIPSGKLADAFTAWRDAGGTIELDRLRLKWGPLGAAAAGTIGLDQELQPAAALNGAIQGYDQILTALVEKGQIRATDAGLARIALNFLAKTGPEGKPEIRTGFRIQDGQMFLGPAKLGKAPHLAWE